MLFNGSVSNFAQNIFTYRPSWNINFLPLISDGYYISSGEDVNHPR